MTTVRELIETLTEVAAGLPGDRDVDVEIGICDGENLRIVEKVDVDDYAEVSSDGVPRKQFVIIRGHLHHAGDGQTLKGVATDVEDELRKLTGTDE